MECMYEHCPSRAFFKWEPKDRDHKRLPDGRTFHFACWHQWQREQMTKIPSVERSDDEH